MKYFIATIHEMINGFETQSKTVVKAMSLKNAEKQLDTIAQTLRDDEPDYEDDKGYYFDNGGIRVHVGRVQEITEAEYKILFKFV